ncbi:MAG: Helix-turn-helix domain [Firmicutes bacterium]|nr:Helix-turn-helix domain [Bacillota bacterium]
MNPYLIQVGEAIKPTRDLLDWTQKELADRIGLSCSTISNLENGPWRMTNTLALAVFSVVLTEMNRRIEEVKYQKGVSGLELLKKIGLTKSRTWSHIIGSVEIASTGLIPLIGGIGMISTGTQATNLSKEELKSFAVVAMDKLQKKLCKIYYIEELSLESFLTKLE